MVASSTNRRLSSLATQDSANFVGRYGSGHNVLVVSTPSRNPRSYLRVELSRQASHRFVV